MLYLIDNFNHWDVVNIILLIHLFDLKIIKILAIPNMTFLSSSLCNNATLLQGTFLK